MMKRSGILIVLGVLILSPWTLWAVELGSTFRAELQAKEQATGLSLLVPGVSWVENSPTRGLDPLPSGLTQAQIDAINQVVAAHVYTPPVPPPDFPGFLRWIPTAFDAPTINAFAKAYPEFQGYAQFGNAVNMAWCITDAKAKGTITAAQYALFQGSNTTYHLGMVLP